jgi:dihydropyrimidinase
LIKGGTVVNAHHQQVADVYIEDGIIVAVNPTITVFLFPIHFLQCSV